MKLGLYLQQLIKSELENLKENANFTEEEMIVFTLLSKGCSRQEIALKNCVSVATVDRRVRAIKNKIKKIGSGNN